MWDDAEDRVTTIFEKQDRSTEPSFFQNPRLVVLIIRLGAETLLRMTVDELGEYGMERLDDEEVEGFLSSHSLGVLGLPTGNEPYLIPMSYGYEGGTQLYFFFVEGDQSRKAELSTQAESATFLVFTAETMFNWRSVSLTGTIQQLPDEERANLTDDQIPGWRPELFDTASETEQTSLYEFRIDDWTGLKHTGLPPGFYGKSGSDQQEG